jgi:riboflavin kinase
MSSSSSALDRDGGNPVVEGIEVTPRKYDWSTLYEDKFTIFEDKILVSGVVVHGFKRGSKELGIPTANISPDEIGFAGDILVPGVYFGYGYLHETMYRAVVSVGWNPHYGNKNKSVEIHLLAKLDDFYGETIHVLLCGFLRDEQAFGGLGM